MNANKVGLDPQKKAEVIKLVQELEPSLVSQVERLINDKEKMLQVEAQGFDPSEFYG